MTDEPESDVEAAVARTDKLYEWRVGEFATMNFAEYAAELLALRHVSPAEARALLAAGCDHATALQILL